MKKNGFTPFRDSEGENKVTLYVRKSKKAIASLWGKSLTGFTLMELMLTIIIVAILVSIAVPNYINTVERAKAREARATLESMRAAEQTYASERRIMIDLDSTDTNWSLIGLENPNSNNSRSWNYSFDAANKQGTATRISGPYSTGSGWTIVLDEYGDPSVTGGP